jgi:hypothetical protein
LQYLTQAMPLAWPMLEAAEAKKIGRVELYIRSRIIGLD